MKDRIKVIRKENNMSQEKFGELLGITKASVSRLESGENNPSEQTVMLICREFSINEEWLRTGQGEMYKPTEDKLEMYLGQISKGNDEFIKDIIEIYMELDQSSKDALKMISIKMAEKQKNREQN